MTTDIRTPRAQRQARRDRPRSTPGERARPDAGRSLSGRPESKPANKPGEAPLTHGDVPEQDGSEDPGAGLEIIRDAGSSAVSSAAGHANKQGSGS